MPAVQKARCSGSKAAPLKGLGAIMVMQLNKNGAAAKKVNAFFAHINKGLVSVCRGNTTSEYTLGKTSTGIWFLVSVSHFSRY